MPPRKKTAAVSDDLCPEHYALGWDGVPAEHNGVGCEHGTWTRTEAQEAQDDTDES